MPLEELEESIKSKPDTHRVVNFTNNPEELKDGHYYIVRLETSYKFCRYAEGSRFCFRCQDIWCNTLPGYTLAAAKEWAEVPSMEVSDE